MINKENVLAYRCKDKRYDCGNKLEYLQATVEYVLKNPELKNRFRVFCEIVNGSFPGIQR